MCGLTGWVCYGKDLPDREATLSEMTATMSCRGPDDSGTWLRESVSLGHRRLAVIDLPGGRQPMTVLTPSGEVAIVYTGEAYNYQELRAELKGRGHIFRTDSDTEVVLTGYLEWGLAVAEHLNGIYGFAVWDGRDRSVHLVRDRLGVKPLYYHPTSGGVVFGSEPKALLAHPSVRRAVGLDGLRELIASTRAPGWALWQGMHEVEPGTVVSVTAAGVRTHTYWRLVAAEHRDDQDTTVSTVRELLTDAVHRQLVSDVPRAVLLSGGLDSSAVTCLAAEHLWEQGERLRTISVDFPGLEEQFTPDAVRATPDGPYVREVAAHVGSAHHTAMVDPARLNDPELRRIAIGARDIPGLMQDLDMSLYLLAHAVRERSTVALSGEAADELFGGYRWFHDEHSTTAGTFPWLAFRGQPLTAGRYRIFRPEILDALDLPTYVADQYATATAGVEHLPEESTVERRMRTVSHLALSRWLRILLDRKDRMTMAVGLEVRVPFCDHRLVEYVYNTPWALKTCDGREKSLLRKATRHVLPESVVQRLKNPYPQVQDPRYAASLQQQVKDILADPVSPVLDLVDARWLADAIGLDPRTMPAATRAGLDRTLDLHHWLDLYRPEVRLTSA